MIPPSLLHSATFSYSIYWLLTDCDLDCTGSTGYKHLHTSYSRPIFGGIVVSRFLWEEFGLREMKGVLEEKLAVFSFQEGVGVFLGCWDKHITWIFLPKWLILFLPRVQIWIFLPLLLLLTGDKIDKVVLFFPIRVVKWYQSRADTITSSCRTSRRGELQWARHISVTLQNLV